MKNITNTHICVRCLQILVVAIALLVPTACDHTPKLHIEGRIAEAGDSMLYFAQTTLEGSIPIDSLRLGKDGTFAFKTAAPDSVPEFYTLSIGRHTIHLCADTARTLTIEAKLPDMERNYTVEGDESNQHLRTISLLRYELQEKLVKTEDSESLYPGEKVDSVESLLRAYKERMKNEYIYQNPTSAESYFAVCQSITDRQGTFMLFNPLTDRTDVKCYAIVATAWDNAYPDAPRTQQLCNMTIKGMEHTALPQQHIISVDEDKVSETGIIDINLPGINGQLHSIRSLKGKAVLLDFTIYAAKESARRTRELRSLYEKYHTRGLEIYQVSLDEDVHFWKFSCENLPWICVHETDGSASRIYDITSIPTFFLVNRDNEIVLRSDFMEGTLEDNLKKIL